MAVITRDGRIIRDHWQRLETAAWTQVGESGLVRDFPDEGSLLAPLKLWRLRRDDLLARRAPAGVLLEPADDPEAIAADVARLALVAVHFPQFTDGRGYSTARLLRSRHGYRGELRAIGDVQRDQLFYLARCGFDAFALRAGEDVRAALCAFGDFSEAYQASVERPQPLFRRRAAAALRGMERS